MLANCDFGHSKIQQCSNELSNFASYFDIFSHVATILCFSMLNLCRYPMLQAIQLEINTCLLYLTGQSV